MLRLNQSLVLRHPLWHTIGLPLLGLLYVRAKDIAKIPAKQAWEFRTKLELAVQALRKFAPSPAPDEAPSASAGPVAAAASVQPGSTPPGPTGA